MNAFVLKMSYRDNLINEGLENDEIIIGWSEAKGLIDESLEWYDFREILYKTYSKKGDSYRASGSWAGSLWRFIRDMQPGDLVVVPWGNEFYVAEVVGKARYEDGFVDSDTAHRRIVKWLNDKKPVPRKYARAALQSRMKARQTCVDAGDLLEEINEAIIYYSKNDNVDFSEELRRKIVDVTHTELYSGRINPHGFEQLVAKVIESLGGRNTIIIARNKDEGADILSDFDIATTFTLKLAVQAKHYYPEPPVEKAEIDQLIKGMEFEGADIGWFVTAGTFSPEANSYWDELKDQGHKIELIDGEQLSAMIVECGLSSTAIFMNN